MSKNFSSISLAACIVFACHLAVAIPVARAGPIDPECTACTPSSSTLFGFISANTTLTHASPGPMYDVIGDVVVNPGVTLTVEPGVTLRFAANTDTLHGGNYTNLSELTIRGRMIADGSSGDSIRFVSSGSGTSEWGAIYITDHGSVILKRIVLDGAVQAFAISSDSTSTIDDSALRHNGSGIDAGSGKLKLRSSILLGLGSNTGLVLGGSASTQPVDTTNATATLIANFTTGADVKGGAMAQNILARDNGTGILLRPGSSISYCSLVRNEFGVVGDDRNLCAGTTATALNSIAAFNSNSGVSLRFYCGCCGSSFGFCDYTDSWSNGTNYAFTTLGEHTASFNPFFVDDFGNNFRLRDDSAFKHYANGNGEIGAYGPGPTSPPTSVAGGGVGVALRARAWPNPAMGRTSLSIEKQFTGAVQVEILDLLGRKVRFIASGSTSPGRQEFLWDARDENGAWVRPGLYLWSVRAGILERVVPIVILR